MESYKVTRMEVLIKNDVLAKCKDSDAIKQYLIDIVVPNMHAVLSSRSKEIGWDVGGSCSSGGGCEIHGGIHGSF